MIYIVGFILGVFTYYALYKEMSIKLLFWLLLWQFWGFIVGTLTCGG